MIAALLILDLVIGPIVLFRLSSAALRSGGAAEGALADRYAHVYVPLLGNQQPRAPSPAPTPTLPAALVPRSPAAPSSALQAKVEIVWPHGGAPLREADLANITVFLLAASGNQPVPCSAEYTVRLWRALNMGAARPIAVGQKRMFTAHGRTFPAWDFNDVDVSPARDPANRLLFFATVDGVATRHNVWVHAADARTVFPQAEQPQAVSTERPALIDARVEILWPHDELPANQARLANIGVYLFDAVTGKALAPDLGAWTPVVRLHWSLNNDADRGFAANLSGRARSVAGANGLRFLAWDFNDIDISAAADSLNKLHFWAEVENTPTLSNIWTHGAAAPTLFPQIDAPASCE